MISFLVPGILQNSKILNMIPNMIPVMIPIMIPWQTCRSSSSSTQYFLFLSLALNTSTLCIYSGAGRPVNTGISSPSDRFICHEFIICSKKELCICTRADDLPNIFRQIFWISQFSRTAHLRFLPTHTCTYPVIDFSNCSNQVQSHY